MSGVEKSAAEQHRRAMVDAARHSNAMEGLTCTPEAIEDQDAFVRGDIDVTELVRRTRARFGLPGAADQPDKTG